MKELLKLQPTASDSPAVVNPQRTASQRFARAMPGPEARAVPCPLCNEKFFPAWAPVERGGKPMEVLGQGSYIGNSLRNHGEDHVEHHEPSRMQEFQEHVEISSNMMILFH